MAGGECVGLGGVPRGPIDGGYCITQRIIAGDLGQHAPDKARGEQQLFGSQGPGGQHCFAPATQDLVFDMQPRGHGIALDDGTHPTRVRLTCDMVELGPALFPRIFDACLAELAESLPHLSRPGRGGIDLKITLPLGPCRRIQRQAFERQRAVEQRLRKAGIHRQRLIVGGQGPQTVTGLSSDSAWPVVRREIAAPPCVPGSEANCFLELWHGPLGFSHQQQLQASGAKAIGGWLLAQGGCDLPEPRIGCRAESDPPAMECRARGSGPEKGGQRNLLAQLCQHLGDNTRSSRPRGRRRPRGARHQPSWLRACRRRRLPASSLATSLLPPRMRD